MPKIKITSQQFLTGSAVLLVLEGLLCLSYLLSLPSDPKNAVWLGYSANRLVLAAVIVIGLGAALYLAGISWRRVQVSQKLEALFQNKPQRTNYLSLVIGGGLVLAALAVSIRFYIPDIYATSFQRILPLLVFITMVLFHSVVLVLTGLTDRLRGPYFWGMVLIFLSGFYVSSTVFHAYEINIDSRRSDQVAWVEFTEKVRESGFRDSGSRNFMPAYAYLQAAFTDVQESVEEQFLAGKLVNTGLSVILLAGAGLIVRKHLKGFKSYVLLSVIAFNLFVFKAAYFQPEIFFYFVYFLIFYLTLRMMRSPDWKLAVLTGLALAVGHYVKASVLPGLLAFGVAFGLKQIVDWWNVRRAPEALRQLMSALAKLVIVVLTFLLVLSPYLLESRARYGSYFYNVNTTFYVWNDNWTQALNGTRQHGDQVGWPDMPSEEIPSFQKYAREHTWEDVVAREMSGLGDAAMNLLRPYGMISYQVLYSVLAVVVLVLNKNRAQKILRSYWPIFLYTLFLFPGYYALFAWYAPLSGSTARFVSGLFIPFMFGLFLLLDKLSDKETQLQIGGVRFSSQQLVKATHWLVLFLIFTEVFFAIPQRLMQLVF